MSALEMLLNFKVAYIRSLVNSRPCYVKERQIMQRGDQMVCLKAKVLALTCGNTQEIENFYRLQQMKKCFV